jgi:uncharacterized membrane protein
MQPLSKQDVEVKRRHYFKSTLAAGFLVVMPLLLTVWLMLWLFQLITAYLPGILQSISPDLEELRQRNALFDFGIRLAGLGVAGLLIYFIGMLTRSVLVSRLIVGWERLLLRVPVFRVIYSTVLQIGRSILNDRPDKMFNKVVLIEYPRRGLWAIGFLTAAAPAEISLQAGQPLHSVFLPTTPNPTSGFLLLVPADEIKLLSMDVADGMRLVISGGVVGPGEEWHTPVATATISGP